MKREKPMQFLNVAVRQAQALSEAERESWKGWKNTNALVPDFLISTYGLEKLISRVKLRQNSKYEKPPL